MPTDFALSSPATPVADPELYAEVFLRYRRFLGGVVLRSGIPAAEVEDVTSEILLQILNKDGLADFDQTRPHKMKAYLATFTDKSSRAWRDRVLTQRSRFVTTSPDSTLLDGEVLSSPAPDTDCDLLERLLEATTGDERVFIQIASECSSYRHARSRLVEELGWSKSRATTAVIRARKAVRTCL